MSVKINCNAAEKPFMQASVMSFWRIKQVVFMLLFLLTAFVLHAQEPSIVTGTVYDQQNKPLANASVMISGTKKGAVTNENGEFKIAAEKGSTIVISNVGFATQKIKIDSRTNYTITLAATGGDLGEVVVVGVQTQTKKKTTTAISSVQAKDIANMPAASVDQILQGRVAGMNVQVSSGEPGVAPTIVVRGNTRVSTNIDDNNVAQAHALSGPLYVIDGIPVNPEDITSSLDATGTNYLAGININDIESVDVQKDAAATAAWGSRGANGVVYIKTKRGRSPVPEFRVNVYGGVIKEPELLQTATGAAERDAKMKIINQYATPAQLATLPQILTDQYNPYFNNATDWQGLFYRSGAIKNVDATISAATENVNYRVSANYYDEQGIIEAFGFKRYSIRGNFDFRITPKLSSQLIFAYSKGDRQRGRKYYNNSDDNTPVSGASQPSSFYRLTAFDSANFTGQLKNLRNKNINDYYTTSLTVNYNILPSLRYTFQGSANMTNTTRDYFQPSNIDQLNAQSTYGEADRSNYATYYISNSLNFNKALKTGSHVHNLAVTGSQQFTADVSKISVVSGYNIPSNNIQVVQGVPQSDIYYAYSDYAADGLLSLTGQAQYDFDNKYLAYVSYRGDASSRFGNNTKWGYFPAAGIGWVVSEEPFMKNMKSVIPFLKIRGSYGVSGSQSGDFYAPYNSYVIPGTYAGGIAVQPSYTNGLTKNNLTWTKTTQKDLGIDAQLFNSRITFSVDFYEKLSKDDYYTFTLPFYTGYESIEFNAHDLWVNNKGYDITLATKNLSPASKLQWNMQVTLSHNTNIIAKLPNNNRTFVVDDYYGTSRIYAVGQPIYSMFQMKYLGVYNNESEIPFNPLTGKKLTYFKGNHTVEAGDPKWLDVNNDGDVWTDEDNGDAYGDRVVTGDPNPKFTGGWVNEFSYKNFSLSILSIFTWKRTIVNTFYQQQISNIVGGYSSSINTFASQRLPDVEGLNYWTPQKAKANPDYKADFPSINPFGKSYYQYIPISSMFNEDGSYFKVKTISLSYRLPESVIKKYPMKGISVYCMVDNVLTLSKSNIPNPELVDQLGIYTGGLYPTPVKFTFGADIQF